MMGASRLRRLGQSHNGVLADATTTDEVELAKLPTMMPFCNFEFGIHVGYAIEISRFDDGVVLWNLHIRPNKRRGYVGDR